VKPTCGLCHKPLEGLFGMCAGHPISGEIGMTSRKVDLYLFEQRFIEDADPDLIDQMRQALRGSRRED
jgi:hypothetical protein